jgi:hypothetical protein
MALGRNKRKTAFFGYFWLCGRGVLKKFCHFPDSDHSQHLQSNELCFGLFVKSLGPIWKVKYFREKGIFALRASSKSLIKFQNFQVTAFPLICFWGGLKFKIIDYP